MTGALEIRKFVVGELATNCYLVYDNDSRKGILIDPGDYDPAISEHIRDNKIEVMYTLDTHGHSDHIRGNASFGFPVLIHELDEPCLSDSRKNRSAFSDQEVKPTKAARLLTDGDIVKVGDFSLEIIHTPGHTRGSISVKCGDILFSGDTLFCEGVGRTDLAEGDQDALVKSIRDKLFILPDHVRVLPGHGPETTIGHEKEVNGLPSSNI
jgi:hydroxyacylglutathione hydrolase